MFHEMIFDFDIVKKKEHGIWKKKSLTA